MKPLQLANLISPSNPSRVYRWLADSPSMPEGELLLELQAALGVSWAYLCGLEQTDAFREVVRIEVKELLGERALEMLDLMSKPEPLRIAAKPTPGAPTEKAKEAAAGARTAAKEFSRSEERKDLEKVLTEKRKPKSKKS
jgi:transcriptional regulator with XRE-family HTH domain